MLRSFEQGLSKGNYKINLLIMAKDEYESVLAEKWQFEVTQKANEEIL